MLDIWDEDVEDGGWQSRRGMTVRLDQASGLFHWTASKGEGARRVTKSGYCFSESAAKDQAIEAHTTLLTSVSHLTKLLDEATSILDGAGYDLSDDLVWWMETRALERREAAARLTALIERRAALTEELSRVEEELGIE